ncbi:MAG: VWA domain-containing protein [Alcaligenaceae bacterium]|nr:VWA domain-containing protein [Alcaligenaceae bacterium]
MLSLNSVTLLWPSLLWVFAGLPFLIGAYLWLCRGQKWSRHGYALLMLCGISLVMFSLARPRAVLLLPGRLDTVMLALDTSGSMRATDVQPSRIEAAQAAVRTFIAEQPSQVKVGIVTVASTAAVAQAPTVNRDELYRAIETLPLQTGSALGSGILVALAQLLPGSGIEVEKILTEADRPPSKDTGKPLGEAGKGSNQVKLEPGSNKALAIVLISDGQSNMGPDVLKMAQLAADHGVRVYTVGVGTPEGIVLKAQGLSMRVKLDEVALKKIAELTMADYYRATNASDLKKVYEALATTIRLEKHQSTEVTALFLALGALVLMLAGLLSLQRDGRVL